MSVDDVVLLIANQSGRSLITPLMMPKCDLTETLDKAEKDGLVAKIPYQGQSGKSVCHMLTENGWFYFGRLTDTNIHFIGVYK
jgi:hypothetical protein